MADVRLEGLEVGDLGALEVGAQHGAGVLPVRAVGGEDALTEKGNEALSSQLGDLEVGELQGQDGLYVFGLAGRHDFLVLKGQPVETICR